MDTVERAHRLVQSGQVETAFESLSNSVKAGDAKAAHELAIWRMGGQLVRRDLAECRRLFGLAWQAGMSEALAPYMALLANGAGGIGRDWPAALDLLRNSDLPSHRQEAELVDKMRLDEEGNPAENVPLEWRFQSPAIATARNFLSAEECEYLESLARPLLNPSTVYDHRSGNQFPHPERTAHAVAFPFLRESPFIHAINRRIAAATGTDCAQGEPIQVLSYQVGEEYRLHCDMSPGDPNPRSLTLLVYLNQSYVGGETHFPALDFSFRGDSGDALVFRNVLPDGRQDRRSAHSGRPVTAGRKMLLSKWIRTDNLDLTGPPGRPF